MRKSELETALTIAQDFNTDLTPEVEQIDVFHGFGMRSFEPVTVTVRMVAALIRWQCCRFDGGIDATALQEIADAGRRKFNVLTPASIG